MGLLHLGPSSRHSSERFSFDRMPTGLSPSLCPCPSLPLQRSAVPRGPAGGKLFSRCCSLSSFPMTLPSSRPMGSGSQLPLQCDEAHGPPVPQAPSSPIPPVCDWLALFLPFGAHSALFSAHTQCTVGPETVVRPVAPGPASAGLLLTLLLTCQGVLLGPAP